MGLQEFKEGEATPYDQLSWLWLVFGIVFATLMGIGISYVMVRVVSV
jgi:succinate dehydrogenase/fumarate reductase cytochrome b subunit